MEQSKQNIFQKMVRYFKDVKAEMKKVVWPSFAKVRQNTLIVLIYVFLVGIVIWLLDMLFTWGMSFIINR
ncbi:MAG TPA: preprotein translocase subunit SecE [Firmicutes bacterium]|nr:preprotein translocase subunit SecE [Bacillota bacterium]